MVAWLRAQAPVIEAAAAVVTALAALAALILIPWQIAQNDRLQREQAAREIYREFLNITIQQASVASLTACSVQPGAQAQAYGAYVEYLVYTAEQVLAVDPEGWRETLFDRLTPHRAMLCLYDPADRAALDPAVAALIEDVAGDCQATPLCPGEE